LSELSANEGTKSMYVM